MAFVTDKEELRPGLIIFRRGDVKHRNWYCRVKLPKADRYKTAALNTCDVMLARQRAQDLDTELRLRIAYDVPVFPLSFREAARRYLLTQEARSRQGQISRGRATNLRSVIERVLNRYIGSTHIHRIEELWGGYPAWRRATGIGRNRRNGVRGLSEESPQTFTAGEATFRHSAGFRDDDRIKGKPEARMIPIVSDATIRYEISILRAVMNHAYKQGYLSARPEFPVHPKLKNLRRDAFTEEECQELYVAGSDWIAAAKTPSRQWSRTITLCMIQVACDTGMRPTEMKNLRWQDLMLAKDRHGRDLIVLSVRGKGRMRKLVAPMSVADCLEQVRKRSKATEPSDRVFTDPMGQPATSLYSSLVADLLKKANLREGAQGDPRSTYCFRHTYATLRLEAGVDVYALAEQMGTSVQLLERRYGHVDLVKHAHHLLDRMAPASI